MDDRWAGFVTLSLAAYGADKNPNRCPQCCALHGNIRSVAKHFCSVADSMSS